MAPACWGDHVRAGCNECAYSFRVGGQKDELPETLVCPNCGYRSIDSSKVKPQPAQLVRVDPIDREMSKRFHRWDVVAIRPSESRPAMIKRVVGLPGESIQFIAGDLFADGAIVRKPLDVAREMRVPVFDSRFGSKEVLSRFQTQDDASDWKTIDGCWQFSPSQEVNRPQWLAYQQWRCVANKVPRDHSGPIEDWYAANVGVNRDLNATGDMWVLIDCQIGKNCRFDLELDRGSASHIFELDFATRSVVLDGLRYPMLDPELSSSVVHLGIKFAIEVCTFDQRMTLLINGREVVSVDLAKAEGLANLESPIQIAGVTSALKIERFRLWRDIHYFDVMPDRKSNGPVALRAGSDEYLLLGDNVPISIDSRHWPSPAVSANQIMGSVSFRH